MEAYDSSTVRPAVQRARLGWFTLIVFLIGLVGDGWSGRPLGLRHQLFLLPITFCFLLAVWKMLFAPPVGESRWKLQYSLIVAFLFACLNALLFLYESKHFAFVGYRLHAIWAAIVFVPLVIVFAVLAFKPEVSGERIFAATLAAYAAPLLLAIGSFPLTYLRSDMLPVIIWADTNLLHHIDPYITMHVGGRLYDFPYLPGMIVAFLPFIAAHIDIRFGSLVYNVAGAALVFWAAKRECRREVAAAIALFLLCPYLQYRHDLYLQPHWFTLIAIAVLMQRRRFVWAAVACGVSMAIYQFSWIFFPFFLLNALRRRGWTEVVKLALAALASSLLIVGPFLASALQRIENNTVGQWSLLPHAAADPMNLAYWVSFFVRPDKLLRVQAALMIVIFIYCFVRNRCADLEDTMRWSVLAITLFVMLNVLVDGYFFLMLAVLMLLYLCVANQWWTAPSLPELYRD